MSTKFDLGFHELRDAGRGVQGDGGPDPADAVLGHAVALQEAAGFVGAVHLEAPAAARGPGRCHTETRRRQWGSEDVCCVCSSKLTRSRLSYM